MNGLQFSGLTWKMATPMKTEMVSSLTKTMTMLVRALSRMPSMSRTMRIRTMPAAGRLMIPPREGALVRDSGRVRPTAVRALLKYPAQPLATAAVATPYSRIRSQPMIQAISSPKAA
ncbi:MAG: hypothetical protein WCZ86_11690 [Desulfurivibrionaceae bacterium]|jgi:hypothetical protein